MWINLQGDCINFNNVVKYKCNKNMVYITYISGSEVYYSYSSEEKVKRVMEYINTKTQLDESLIML